MSKPTDEQKKEFWEWYGFTILLDGMCLYPEDKGISGRTKLLPPVNLNNLFKHVVSRGLVKQGMQINFTSPDTMRDFPKPNWRCDGELFNYGRGFTFQGEGETPALALFWALWKVKEQCA